MIIAKDPPVNVRARHLARINEPPSLPLAPVYQQKFSSSFRHGYIVGPGATRITRLTRTLPPLPSSPPLRERARYPVVQTIKLIVKVINTYARTVYTPQGSIYPVYTYAGGGVPAYVLDYTANTVLQELAWSGTCCSYSQREVERDGCAERKGKKSVVENLEIL